MDMYAFTKSFMSWLERDIKQPVAKRLNQWGITPDMLTISGVFTTLLAGFILVFTHQAGWAGVVYALGSFTDFFDGALARLQPNRDFRFGGWLDAFCDRTSEVILFGAIILGYFTSGPDQWISFFAFGAGLLLSIVKALAGEKGVDVDWTGREFLGYPMRVAIVAVGMLATFVFPNALLVAVYLLLFVNVPIFVLRINKVLKARKLS